MRVFLLLTLCVVLTMPAWSQEYCDRSFWEGQYDNIGVKEVFYGSGTIADGRKINLAMDVYFSDAHTKDFLPAVILLHGGSFIREQGEKEQLKEVGEYFASRGFVVFSINYRTWSVIRDGFPSADDILDVAVKALQDAQKAIDYVVRENDGTIFPLVDVQQLIIGGVSAGAITVNHLLYMDSGDNIPGFFQQALDRNDYVFRGDSEKYHIAYGINLSGGIIDPGWIDAGEPPLISFHGSADDVIPYEFGLASGIIELYGSKKMDERLRETGGHSYLYTFEGGGHSDIYSDQIYRKELLEAIDIGLDHIRAEICVRSSSPELPERDLVHLINTLVNDNLFLVNEEPGPLSYHIITAGGKTIRSGVLRPGQSRISFDGGPSGYYILYVSGHSGYYTRAFVRM